MIMNSYSDRKNTITKKNEKGFEREKKKGRSN